jgi:DNA-binding response OmpR family regulator
MPETILVVEDEPALRDTLTYNLKKDGFTVETVEGNDDPHPHAHRPRR